MCVKVEALEMHKEQSGVLQTDGAGESASQGMGPGESSREWGLGVGGTNMFGRRLRTVYFFFFGSGIKQRSHVLFC